MLWAASIVAVAVLAGSAVWSRTADDRNLASDYRHTLDVAHGRGLSAAPMMVEGKETGTVFAYEGHEGSPSWVYVTFRTPPQLGQYDVHLVTKDGRRLPLRPFTARPGGIAWGSIIPVSTKEIATIEFEPVRWRADDRTLLNPRLSQMACASQAKTAGVRGSTVTRSQYVAVSPNVSSRVRLGTPA